ncbi:hypothetical protein HT031_001307 [Scenedesmus sp. PABB004]|nr:hypothetical protein HT031_001307 [Scenedesmus sp. PABB004]
MSGAVSAYDVRRAAGGEEDAGSVRELAFCFRAATRLGALTALQALTSLSVAFNALESLRGVGALSSLRHLNCSHNRLASLEPVTGLRELTRRAAAALRGRRRPAASPIRRRRARLELTPPRPRRAAPRSLNAGCNLLASTAPLAALTGLRALALHANALPGGAAVLDLSGLTCLRHVALARNPMCRQEHSRLATLALLPGLETLDGRAVAAEERAAAAAHADAWARAARDGDLSSSADGDGASCGGARQGSRLAGSAGRLAPRPGSGTRACEGGGASCIKDAAALLPCIAVPPLKPSSLARRPAAEALPPPSPCGHTRARPLTTVHQQRCGARRTRQRMRQRGEAWRARPEPPGPAACPLSPAPRYIGSTASGPAVLVRSDGSAALTWPDGSLAASLDAADDGAGGGAAAGAAAAPPASYRLLAMHRSVLGVAASFDAGGGFAQYADGSLALVWSARDGGGTAYAPGGAVTHAFNTRRRGAAPRCDVVLHLGPHLTATFVAATRELVLAFDCDGCAARLSSLHGAVLPPPPGGGGDEGCATALLEAAAAAARAPPSLAAAEPAASVGGSDTAALLARARALMAAEFGDDEPAGGGGGAVVPPPPAEPQAPGAAPPDDDGGAAALIARARALLAHTRAPRRRPRLAAAAAPGGPAAPWAAEQRQQQRQRDCAAAARARRGRQDPGEAEAESSADEAPPPVDLGRRAEAISAQLGLPAAGVRAVVRAHPALAGVPLERLVRCLPPLAHALGVPLAQALFMAARAPGVLDADPAALLGAAAALADAVALPAEQVAFMAARQPGLLDAPPARMAAEAAKLGAALGCSTRGGLQLLSRLGPAELHAVLSMSGGTVARRLPEVLEALGLPSDSTARLDMLSLVAKHPGLLAASLSDVGRSTDALLVAFQQSAPLTFAAVLGRCPSLLTLPAEALLANYQGLLLALGVGRPTLARVLARHPQLLRSPPDAVAAKLRWMAFRLYLPQAQVVAMVVRQPALLSRDSAALGDALSGLQATLGTSYAGAVAAVARAPNLLLWAPASLARKHALLLDATGLPPARLNALLLQQPGLLTLGVDALTATLDALRDVLGLAGPALGALLLADPRVLLRGGRVLSEQVAELQEYLALPAATIRELVVRCPGVLRAGSAVWLANITTLLEVLGLTPQQVQGAVLAKPQVLRLPPGRLVRTARRLAQLAGQAPGWRAELGGLGGAALARLLRLDARALWRLAYLADTRQAGGLAADAALAANNARWAARHAGFDRWLRRQRRSEAASAGAAQAAAAAGGPPPWGSDGARPPAARPQQRLQRQQQQLEQREQQQRWQAVAGLQEQRQERPRQQPEQQLAAAGAWRAERQRPGDLPARRPAPLRLADACPRRAQCLAPRVSTSAAMRRAALALLAGLALLTSVSGHNLVARVKVADCTGAPVVGATVKLSGCVVDPVLLTTDANGTAETPLDGGILYCYTVAGDQCLIEVTSAPNGLSRAFPSQTLTFESAPVTPKQYMCKTFGCCHPCNQPDPFLGGLPQPAEEVCQDERTTFYVQDPIVFAHNATTCAPVWRCGALAARLRGAAGPPAARARRAAAARARPRLRRLPARAATPPPARAEAPPPAHPRAPVRRQPPPTFEDMSGETCFAWFGPTLQASNLPQLLSLPAASASFRQNQQNDTINGVTLSSGALSLNAAPTTPTFAPLPSINRRDAAAPRGAAARRRSMAHVAARPARPAWPARRASPAPPRRAGRWGWETLWRLSAPSVQRGLMYCGQNMPGGTVSMTVAAGSLTYELNMGTNFTRGDLHVYAACAPFAASSLQLGSLNCNPTKLAGCASAEVLASPAGSALLTRYRATITLPGGCPGGVAYSIIHLGL